MNPERIRAVYREVKSVFSDGVRSLWRFTKKNAKYTGLALLVACTPQPAKEAQRLVIDVTNTPTPTETPVPPTATPEPTSTPESQRAGIPPKPPTPTPTPIGTIIKIPEHLFPKDSTFFASFKNPNVSGALLVRVDPVGNITYAEGVKRNCTPNENEPDISYLATKMLPGDIRPVVIKFNRQKTNLGLEVQPDLKTLRGSVEFEPLQLGAKTCLGGKVNVEAQRRGPGLENLGRSWNDVLASVDNVPASWQAALDELNGLCKPCNIFSQEPPAK